MTETQTFDELLAKHQITITSEFVPYSKSRSFKPNAKSLDKNLNWKITLLVAGKPILTTDYSAGCAHCPGYKNVNPWKLTVAQAEVIDFECENGKMGNYGSGWVKEALNAKPILPKLTDVVSSLFLDADATHHCNFEEWAKDLGMNPDSRKDEKIYRACLEIGLALRNSLPAAVYEEIREAAQNY